MIESGPPCKTMSGGPCPSARQYRLAFPTGTWLSCTWLSPDMAADYTRDFLNGDLFAMFDFARE
jgi:hypothetical protein